MKQRLMILAQELSGAPAEFQLFPYGEVMTDDGPIIVDELAIQMTIAAFEARGNDLVIDYEHQTLYGGEAPAAGWIRQLLNKGNEGLWAAVEWTEKAKGYLDRREYRYFSPVSFRRESDSRLAALHSVALTNSPKTHHLTALVAKLEISERSHNKEEVMEKAKLIALLKLKAEATDAEIEAAILALQKPVEVIACKEVMEALGLGEKTGKSEAVATIHALKQQTNVVSIADFNAMKKRLAERDRDELVALALKDNKITPAQKEWADAYALRDPEGFKLFIAKAPAVIDTGERAGGKGPDREGSIDDVQMQINKQLGVTEDVFRKHNKVS